MRNDLKCEINIKKNNFFLFILFKDNLLGSIVVVVVSVVVSLVVPICKPYIL